MQSDEDRQMNLIRPKGTPTKILSSILSARATLDAMVNLGILPLTIFETELKLGGIQIGLLQSSPSSILA